MARCPGTVVCLVFMKSYDENSNIDTSLVNLNWGIEICGERLPEWKIRDDIENFFIQEPLMTFGFHVVF